MNSNAPTALRGEIDSTCSWPPTVAVTGASAAASTVAIAVGGAACVRLRQM